MDSSHSTSSSGGDSSTSCTNDNVVILPPRLSPHADGTLLQQQHHQPPPTKKSRYEDTGGNNSIPYGELEKILLFAVKGGFHLAGIPDAFCNDREVVMVCLKEETSRLHWGQLSEELKTDFGVVRTALENDCMIYGSETNYMRRLVRWNDLPEKMQSCAYIIKVALENGRVEWNEIPRTFIEADPEIAALGVTQGFLDFEECPNLQDHSALCELLSEQHLKWRHLPADLQNSIEFANFVLNTIISDHDRSYNDDDCDLLEEILQHVAALRRDRGFWRRLIRQTQHRYEDVGADGEIFSSCPGTATSSCYELPSALRLRHKVDCSAEDLQQIAVVALDLAVLGGFITICFFYFQAAVQSFIWKISILSIYHIQSFIWNVSFLQSFPVISIFKHLYNLLFGMFHLYNLFKGSNYLYIYSKNVF